MPINARLIQLIAVLACLLSIAGARAGTGAVAMPDPYSADASAAILARGGNAADAMITGMFVAAVTHPNAGNIGGGGFMTAFIDGESSFLDFREVAPAGAGRDMFLDEGGEYLPRRALVGGLASGVPGTVRGLAEMHQRFGSLPWSELIQPAIDLARDGFVPYPVLLSTTRDQLAYFGDSTNFRKYFGGMREDQVFRQPELASTLERIAKDPDDFYRGTTASLLVDQMRKDGGLITLQDLAAYRAIWREPLVTEWREHEVITAPPPSSGGIALLQLLQLRDLSNVHFQDVWHNSGPYIHLLAELEKRVFADRAEYLGDPKFVDNKVQALLDDDYLRSRAKTVDPDAISPMENVRPGLEPMHTAHLSVLDAKGNAVSLTTTINDDYGSGVVVEGAGFLLNSEMDDFAAKPGAPNLWGAVGNENNAIAPGKRMLSSMTPTILVKEDKPVLVVGAMGGTTIITSVFQVILNIIDHDMDVDRALNTSRYHHQLPQARRIAHDPRPVPADTKAYLEGMGYTLEENSWGPLGEVAAILVRDGRVSTSPDRRYAAATRLVPVK